MMVVCSRVVIFEDGLAWSTRVTVETTAPDEVLLTILDIAKEAAPRCWAFDVDVLLGMGVSDVEEVLEFSMAFGRAEFAADCCIGIHFLLLKRSLNV
jgi:hypothetical protein